MPRLASVWKPTPTFLAIEVGRDRWARRGRTTGPAVRPYLQSIARGSLKQQAPVRTPAPFPLWASDRTARPGVAALNGAV